MGCGCGMGMGTGRPWHTPMCRSFFVPDEGLAFVFSLQQIFTAALLSAHRLLGAENTAVPKTDQPHSLRALSLWPGKVWAERDMQMVFDRQ